MIEQHPHDDLLLSYAAGTLASGPSVVLAAHLEVCEHCLERLRLAKTLGGALLDEIAPVPLDVDALARTLAAIDAPEGGVLPPAPPRPPLHRPPLPEGAAWPQSLQHCSATPWRFIAPGMRWSRVSVPWDPAANVFLLRIGAGKSLPKHSHDGRELTQVLHGAFEDSRGIYRPGDFDEADPHVHHEPVVRPGGACICLTSVEGRMRFDGVVARWFASLVGM